MCNFMPHTQKLDEMDYFLGKYKLLKWSEETEKLDNPVADGEIEKVVKKIHP